MVIPALKRWRQEDCLPLQASLVYAVNSKPVRATWYDPVLVTNTYQNIRKEVR